VDLRRLFRVVRAWFPLLVASVVLAGAAAYYISSHQPNVFQARATLVVGQSLAGVNPTDDQLLVSQSLAATYSSVATTPALLTKVIDKLGLKDTPERLAQRVSASATPGSVLLTITAQDGDAARAADLANAVSEELIAAAAGGQSQQTEVLTPISADLEATRGEIAATQSEIAQLSVLSTPTPTQEATLETLQSRLAMLLSTYATLLTSPMNNAANSVSVVQPAVTPDSPVSPHPPLTALLAAMVAFLVVTAIAYAKEALDDTIADSNQVLETLGLATIGTIMRVKGGKEGPSMLAAMRSPRSPAAEAYRTLRANVEFASLERPIKTLLVTSALPAEGRTVTAANLAVVFAQEGRRVLLIDADLRQPGAHAIFALPNMHGLTTLMRSDDAGLETVIQATEQENLYLLSAGPPLANPAEVLRSKRMHSVLTRLSADFDLLIFDSPPLEIVADSAVLSSLLDGTLLVVDAARSRRAPARSAAETLATAKANMLGVVLNRLSWQASTDYARYYGPQARVAAGAGSDSS
jgi:capsular exopolysaccharide synthesis family protein